MCEKYCEIGFVYNIEASSWEPNPNITNITCPEGQRYNNETSSCEDISTPSVSTEPTSTEPPSTQITSTETTYTQPTSTQPTSTEPTSTDPTSTDPKATEPTKKKCEGGKIENVFVLTIKNY